MDGCTDGTIGSCGVCVVVGFCCNIPHVIILKNRRQVFLIYKAIFFNICNSFLQI